MRELGTRPDAEVDPALTALAVAAINRPGISVGRYIHHLNMLTESLRGAYNNAVAGGAADDAALRLGCLKFVMMEQNGYDGDRETYDDLQNADLISVIDRRKGLPVALSILCVHAARSLGWIADPMEFPGHVFCRIDHAGQRILFDPFNSFRTLGAPELRSFLKTLAGPEAELSLDMLKPATNRGVLIRLQNNIKYRLIAAEDYAGAIKIIEIMRKIDPAEYRLHLDAGVLYARENQAFAAMRALENYIAGAPPGTDTSDARLLLSDIRSSLN